jgi:hypothetical protein
MSAMKDSCYELHAPPPPGAKWGAASSPLPRMSSLPGGAQPAPAGPEDALAAHMMLLDMEGDESEDPGMLAVGPPDAPTLPRSPASGYSGGSAASTPDRAAAAAAAAAVAAATAPQAIPSPGSPAVVAGPRPKRLPPVAPTGFTPAEVSNE